MPKLTKKGGKDAYRMIANTVPQPLYDLAHTRIRELASSESELCELALWYSLVIDEAGFQASLATIAAQRSAQIAERKQSTFQLSRKTELDVLCRAGVLTTEQCKHASQLTTPTEYAEWRSDALPNYQPDTVESVSIDRDALLAACPLQFPTESAETATEKAEKKTKAA